MWVFLSVLHIGVDLIRQGEYNDNALQYKPSGGSSALVCPWNKLLSEVDDDERFVKRTRVLFFQFIIPNLCDAVSSSR